MKLMHIAAADRDGMRLDRHVVATDAQEALALWIAATDDDPEDDVLDLVQDVVVILPDVTGTIYDGPAQVVDRSRLETLHDRVATRDPSEASAMVGDDIAVPEQECILRLVGGYVQRPGDPASPTYQGRLETSSGMVVLEVRTEPGGLYDARGLVDLDGARAFGHGWREDADVDETALEPIRDPRAELRLRVDGQTVAMTPVDDQSSYRVRVLCGVLRTDAGDWSVTLLGKFLSLNLGYGSYRPR